MKIVPMTLDFIRDIKPEINELRRKPGANAAKPYCALWFSDQCVAGEPGSR